MTFLDLSLKARPQLLIANDFPPVIGGQSAYLYYLCKALSSKNMIVLAPECGDTRIFDQDQPFEIIRKPYLISTPVFEKIVKIVVPFFLAIGIIKERDIKTLHCAHVLSTGFVGLLIKKFLGIDYVVYTHSADILEHLPNFFLRFWLRRILFSASFVVANSGFTRSKLEALGVDAKKIICSFPKIDAAEFSAPADSNIFKKHGIIGKRVILSINRLVERKGNDMVIAAMPDILKAHPDALYVIFGRGKYKKKLENQVLRLGLKEKVLFIEGDNGEKKSLLKACDVFVMISREIKEKGDAEGFGVVYLEAGAAGKAVVAGDSGGVRDAVKDHETGLLVAPQDPKAVAAAVIKILSDKELAARLGTNGLSRVTREFDFRLGAPELDVIFQGNAVDTIDTSKTRVLHIITRLDPGGSTTNTLETVARLDKERYHVDLVAGLTHDKDNAAGDFIREHGIRCVYINEIVRSISPIKDVQAFFKLKAFIKDGRYDIVHTHSSKAGILGRWAAFFAGVKKIVHTPHGHIFYGYFHPLVVYIFVWMEMGAAMITTRLIALTYKGVEEHTRFHIGAIGQWVVVFSGIDLKNFEPSADTRQECRRELGLDDKDFVFVSVTRLEPIKNNKTVIEAFCDVVKTYPHSRLVFAGDGVQNTMLRQKTVEAGISDKVLFLGYQKDVARFLNMADVFVLASLNEGMGRAAVEGMAMGLPVIVSRAGGLPEVVTDDQQGFWVEPLDVAEWALIMKRMIEKPDLRRDFGARAREHARKNFSVEVMVKKIDEVYRFL
ncbi:MAG: glycosyltransferase [Candidatus Omnitrophica bacterium]|nr:glycosyltransferase [Candidatus Omnitrophota bacterium]